MDETVLQSNAAQDGQQVKQGGQPSLLGTILMTAVGKKASDIHLKVEIEGEMGDSHMGLQARLMSQALRKLTSAIARSSAFIFCSWIAASFALSLTFSLVSTDFTAIISPVDYLLRGRN